jgi:hypothetical protein
MPNKAELDVIANYTPLAHLCLSKDYAAIDDTIFQTLAAAKNISAEQVRQQMIEARKSNPQ